MLDHAPKTYSAVGSSTDACAIDRINLNLLAWLLRPKNFVLCTGIALRNQWSTCVFPLSVNDGGRGDALSHSHTMITFAVHWHTRRMSGDHQVVGDRWTLLAADFKLGQLPATLGTGLVLAFVNCLLGIALISLMFQGDLEAALPIGIGFGLVASAVLAFVIAIGSSFPGVYEGYRTPAQRFSD